jgi:hypothetical protein
MEVLYIMKKIFIPFLIALIFLGTASLSRVVANNEPSIKVNNQKQIIKVFVGRPSNHIILDKYTSDRKNELTKLVKEDEDRVIDVLIVLNKFVDANEARSIIDSKDIEIKRIWISANGSQAGGDAVVVNNDVHSSLMYWKEEFDKSYDSLKNGVGYDILYKALQNDKIQIYALLVSAPVAKLDALDDKAIYLIDAHYSQKALEIASNKNYEVRYIDCPRRPDGI